MRHELHLSGHGLRLEPLRDRHAAALLALVDDDLWAGMSWPVPRVEADLRAWIADAHAQDGRYAFAVVGDDDQVRGSTSFYEAVDSVPRVEIGYTFYGRSWWGGTTNPACKLLLLTQAFDEWGMARVALRAASTNTRSIAAIRRLGAVPEGVLRHHRRTPDGALADTAYFSILAQEWPAVRAGLEERLA